MQEVIKGNFSNVETATKKLQYGIPSKSNPKTKEIPTIQYWKPLTKPQTDIITYNLYVEILKTVEYATADPEILNDVSEYLEEFIYKPDIKTAIVKLEELDNRQYIDRLFIDLYTEEELNGLEETSITPEQYNYKILELLKKEIQQETGHEDIKIIGSEALEIKNPELLKHQIGYYIENDLFKDIKEAINQVLYYLHETQETADSLTQFIYMNSYYNE